MSYASKKLVVSFGTFSCELDGFDNPFPIMREAVDFFQNLNDANRDSENGDIEPDIDALEAMLVKVAKAEQNVEIERSATALRLVSAPEEAVAAELPEASEADLEATSDEVAPIPQEAAEADEPQDFAITEEVGTDLAASLADLDLGEDAETPDAGQDDEDAAMDQGVLDDDAAAKIADTVPWAGAGEGDATEKPDLKAEAEDQDLAASLSALPEDEAATAEPAAEAPSVEAVAEDAPPIEEVEPQPAAPKSLLRSRRMTQQQSSPLFTSDHLASAKPTAPATPEPPAKVDEVAAKAAEAANAADIEDAVASGLSETAEDLKAEAPVQDQPASEEDTVITRLVERDEFITKAELTEPAEAKEEAAPAERPKPLDLGMVSKPIEEPQATPEPEPEQKQSGGGFSLSGLRKTLRLGGGDEAPVEDKQEAVKPEVVKPSAPTTEAIDPLQLTKALRVEEETDETAEPAPAPSTEIRPEMHDLTAETSAERRQKLRIIRNEPETEDDEEEVEGEFVDDGEMNLRNFAHRVGAASLTELLEASAAYRTIVEEQQSFSRPAVLNMVDEISGEKNYTAEARIKSFGKLLRTGKIIRVDNGQFAVSSAVRFNYESKMGA